MSYLDYHGGPELIRIEDIASPADATLADGYLGYHGGYELAVVSNPTGTCSIEPTTAGKSSRIDQGATWWCDYTWMVGDTAIDLDGYEVTASFYYPDGSLFTRIENAPENESLFRLRLTDELTDTIDFGGEDCIELTVDIDLERVDTPDMITGYIPGDVVRVCAGTIVAYRRGAGAQEAIEPTSVIARSKTIRIYTGEEAERCVSLFDCKGNPVSLSGQTFDFLSWNRSRNIVINTTATGNDTGFCVTIPKVAKQQKGEWALRSQDVSATVIACGPMVITGKPVKPE